MGTVPKVAPKAGSAPVAAARSGKPAVGGKAPNGKPVAGGKPVPAKPKSFFEENKVLVMGIGAAVVVGGIIAIIAIAMNTGGATPPPPKVEKKIVAPPPTTTTTAEPPKKAERPHFKGELFGKVPDADERSETNTTGTSGK
jgi:hypothetical protein